MFRKQSNYSIELLIGVDVPLTLLDRNCLAMGFFSNLIVQALYR